MSVNLTVDKDGQKRVEIPFSLIKSLNEAVDKATYVDHATDGVFRLKVSENKCIEWTKGPSFPPEEPDLSRRVISMPIKDIPNNSDKTFVPTLIVTDRFHRANAKPEPSRVRPRTKTYLLRGLGRPAL